MLIPNFKSVLRTETLRITVNRHHLVRKIIFQQQTSLLDWRSSEKSVKYRSDPGEGLEVCKMSNHLGRE